MSISEIRSKLKKAKRKVHQEEANFERSRSRRDYWRRIVRSLEDRLESVGAGQTEMPAAVLGKAAP